jgi:hypothetical protein
LRPFRAAVNVRVVERLRRYFETSCPKYLSAIFW